MSEIASSEGSRFMDKPWGALLEQGPADWQILQQGSDGTTRGGEVQIRMVREETGLPVDMGCAWQSAETLADGSWRGAFASVPAGGPYRLETRFNPKGNKLGEWSLRGDMRHFLGVGDLWLVAGQSNASGYGRSAYQDPPEIGLQMLRQQGGWSLATHPLHDSTDTVFPASRETYNTGHSPFLHFARRLKQELGHPIALLPAALGGSPLDAWHPNSGPLFANLMAMVKRTGGKVRGMLWYQGETDAEPGKAGDYLERFLTAVAGWRRALGQPDLPILTVQLARYRSAANPGEEDLEWSQLREAQRQAAHEIPGLTVVPALDLPLDDTIHIATSGNYTLGERLARCALGSVYGRKIDYRAPEPESIVMESERVVAIRFSHVLSRLENHDAGSMPFRAEDEAGVIPIEKLIHFHRDSVKLFLTRPVKGTARISCGYGENPGTLPIDIERQMPVLAFHGIAASR
jgi:sialate O-acetylesterase